MRQFRKLMLITLILVMFGLPATTFAEDLTLPKLDDRIIFGGTFRLEEGETVDGSLIVFGGTITLEEGSTVTEDVVLVGSTATFSGTVHGDVVGIGGVVTITETAIIHGDLVAPGGVLNRDGNARVDGQIISQGGTINFDMPEISRIDVFSTPPNAYGAFGFGSSPALALLWFTFRVFAFSAVAVLMILFIPKHTQRTRAAMMGFPVLSGGLGFLTVVVAIPAIVLLAITVILSPASVLVVIIIFLGILIGWLSVGVEIGSRMSDGFNKDWSLAMQAGLGTFVLTLLTAIFNTFLWGGIGWLLGITIGSIGLGAVLLTRFGTREYSSPKNMSSELVEIE